MKNLEGFGIEHTPEEIAEIEKTRTLSDATLLTNGGEYKIDKKGNKVNLLVPKEDKQFIKRGGEGKTYLEDVIEDAESFKDVPEKFKNDEQFIITACLHNPEVLKFVDKDLINDEDFVKKLLRAGGAQRSLPYLPAMFSNDVDIMLAAVQGTSSDRAEEEVIKMASPQVQSSPYFQEEISERRTRLTNAIAEAAYKDRKGK